MSYSSAFLAVALALGVGCADAEDEALLRSSPAQPAFDAADEPAVPAADPPAVAADADAAVAVAALEPLDGSDASGRATLTATPDGVLFSVALRDLPPDGLRALHIHEGGSCERPGGLFNPDGAPLGSPLRTRGRRPPGALGNAIARDEGNARFERVEPLVSLNARERDPSSVLGRTVVVHARQDDYHTAPEGGPGPAVACGVILPS